MGQADSTKSITAAALRLACHCRFACKLSSADTAGSFCLAEARANVLASILNAGFLIGDRTMLNVLTGLSGGPFCTDAGTTFFGDRTTIVACWFPSGEVTFGDL